MEYVLLIVGFILLIKGADIFVDGASSIAGKLKVPSLIIGLTVVSIGTSLPEAAVSLSASLSGTNEISLGNVIGSNIFNILVVVGISSAILPIITDMDILKRDMPINLAATVTLFIMLIDRKLTRAESIILLVFLATYMFMLIRSALKSRSENAEEEETKILSWPKSIIFVVLGAAAIIGGGQLVVNSAKTIASALGMSETLIGLTVVAFGTSLPELVTSIVAAKKGDSGIAMGNVVGSCLFNILFILGLTGTITPMTASLAMSIDTGILIGVSALMILFAYTKRKTSRWEGIVFTSMYVVYTAYIIMRAYGVAIF
jgi:cation:H+ antiporter